MKAVFGALFALVLVVTLFAESDSTEIPAYHKSAPAAGASLAPILAKDKLWGPSFENAYQVHAYELAPQISKILYQLPCYCYCDHMGHKSLRTCYESTHAAHCAVCLKELYYAYGENKKGRTVAQIREGIIKGEWQNVDLEAAAGMN